MTKILVAYFSATGTTGMAATALAEIMEGVMLNGEWSKDGLAEMVKEYL